MTEPTTKRRPATAGFMVAGAVLFLASVSLSALPVEEQEFTLHSDVRLVLLDVSVKDRPGELVSGLTRENFAVFENGKRQPITVFAHDDLPVTVGILVDESFSMRPKRAEVLSAAETFIGASNPRDEIFVLNFNDRVTRGLPHDMLFSDNPAQLRSALHRGVPQGKTALYDAVVDGLQQLERGKRDKKALIVISDGGDNASRHTRRETLDMVAANVATVYTVGLYDAGDPDRDPGLLNGLARISGGSAYFPAVVDEMVPVCRGIAQDIRTRYTIGYVPPEENGKGSLRRIRVRVSAPGAGKLTVHARTSYRYEKPEGQTTR